MRNNTVNDDKVRSQPIDTIDGEVVTSANNPNINKKTMSQLSSDNIYVIVPLLRKEAVSSVFDRFVVDLKGGNDSATIVNYLEGAPSNITISLTNAQIPVIFKDLLRVLLMI